MKKIPLRAFPLAMLFGALLGAGEGLGLLHFSGLRFEMPWLEILGLQWRYALLGAVLVPVAYVVAGLLRLKRDTAPALASWVLGTGVWVLGNYWVQARMLRGSSMFGGEGLGWFLGLTADVFVIHLLVRAAAHRAPRAALRATVVLVLLLPVASPWIMASSALGEHAADTRGKPDVTLVVIDTLRADHLGTYGYRRADGQAVSPLIDQLAARGAVFENCWAQAPWTRPSMASMHSGLFCSSHKVNNELAVLGDDARTIAELLYQQGYRTGGYSANFNVSVSTGFGQGFEELWTIGVERSLVSFTAWGEVTNIVFNRLLRMFTFDGQDHAALVNEQVFDWIERTKEDPRPKFTYVHYIDPHTPYEPPPGGWLFDTEQGDWEGAARPAKVGSGEFPYLAFEDPGAENVATVVTAYDAEIRYVDQQLGELIERLEANGLLDDEDWLFITSDHGEEFFEHGGWGHGGSLFEEQLHIPFIVLGPGVEAGSRIKEEIRLLDIHSTLGLIGGHSEDDLAGKTFSLPLQPLFRNDGNDELEPRRLLAERIQVSELYAFRSGFRKIIEQPDMDALAKDEKSIQRLWTWFDLEQNPDEILPYTPADLWAEKPLPRAEASFEPPPELHDDLMIMKLEARTKSLDGVFRDLKDLSAAERAMMEALGYLDAEGNLTLGGESFLKGEDNQSDKDDRHREDEDEDSQ